MVISDINGDDFGHCACVNTALFGIFLLRWRHWAMTLLLGVSFVTLFLQIQYVIEYQANQKTVLNFITGDAFTTRVAGTNKLHLANDATNNSSINPRPIKMTSPTQAHSLPTCKSPSYTAVCAVDVAAFPWQKDTSGHKTQPGSIKINHVIVYKWQIPAKCFTVRLDHKCNVIEIIKYSNNNHSKWRNISEYLHSLPSKIILIGVCYGKSQESAGLIELGIQQDYNNHLTKRGILSFLGWTAYPGHTRTSTTPRGRSVNKLSSKFHVGIPFNVSTTPETYSTTVARHPTVKHGGHWFPKDCNPRWRIAIVVPFRNREDHLFLFLDNIIRFLEQQKLAFVVFVIEQVGPELFNRATLMNIGYLEAKKVGHFDCYAFHDVDLIPEDLTNVYACAKEPRHLVVTRSVTKYELRHKQYFGGGISLSSEMMIKINGFPNHLFGWGGEDDNIYARVSKSGAKILRYPLEIARYVSLPHLRDEGNPNMKRHAKDMYSQVKFAVPADGLSTVHYVLLATEWRTLYTHVFVRIPGPTTQTEAEHLTIKQGALYQQASIEVKS